MSMVTTCGVRSVALHVVSAVVISSTLFQHWNLLEKGFFCRRFHRSEGPLQKNFLQITVEEDLKFLLSQITLKYSKKWRETAAAPRVFARWAHVDHPPLLWCSSPIFYKSIGYFWKNFVTIENSEKYIN